MAKTTTKVTPTKDIKEVVGATIEDVSKPKIEVIYYVRKPSIALYELIQAEKIGDKIMSERVIKTDLPAIILRRICELIYGQKV